MVHGRGALQSTSTVRASYRGPRRSSATGHGACARFRAVDVCRAFARLQPLSHRLTMTGVPYTLDDGRRLRGMVPEHGAAQSTNIARVPSRGRRPTPTARDNRRAIASTTAGECTSCRGPRPTSHLRCSRRPVTAPTTAAERVPSRKL